MIRYSVAVFAHNEEATIARCVTSVLADVGTHPVKIHVLVNGSTDLTLAAAGAVATRDRRVHVHDIRLGDKCNAWNHYIHRIKDAADIHVFVDGDCHVVPGSLAMLAAALTGNHAVNAAAAIPKTGRSAQSMIRKMRANPGVAGNLYALPARFIERIRRRGIALPVGLVGDDSLVGALAATDLGTLADYDPKRIALCHEAGFLFDSLDIFDPADAQLYYRRLVRYSLRHFENMMVREVLAGPGAAGLPATAQDLHRRHAGACHLAWRGLATPFDIIAYFTRITRGDPPCATSA